MRRLLVILAVVAALAAPASALAHPLGNFTVNRHTEIELSGGRLYVHYALDLAEIPTFQLGTRVRAASFGAEAARGLELRLDGRRAPLRLLERRVVERAGAGGLKTLRFDAVYAAAGSGSRLAFHDRNFPSRIGWREVVVRAEEGAELRSASVPAESRSDGLRAYPDDLLRSPLDVVSATASFTLGDGAGTPPQLRGETAAEHSKGGFESLVSRGDLSLGVILLSLAIAAFWGAAHALTPGHGKAIVAGYLVGTKGRPIDAVLLGGIVTITHTIGVFALGFVTLLLSRFIVPETLYPWLTLTSGLLVVVVGGSVLFSRARRRGDHHHPRPQPRARSPPRPSPRPARPARRRHRRRLAALPVGTRCPAQRDRTAPCRLRPRADRRLQPRPRSHDHLDRARRRPCQAGLQPHLTRRPAHPSPAGRECSRDPRGRNRHHCQRSPGGALAMFGLDDHIAAMSNGGSVLLVLLVAALLGLRHATDPDHIAAVTALVASGRERASRRAAELGVFWGLGHALTLVVFGLPILLFEAYLPERLQQGAESAVAALIVFLAVRLLIRWRSGYFHLHAHSHGPEDESHRHKVRTPLGAFGIGLVHGMGGSAGVGVLLLAAIPSKSLAVVSLVILAAFTAVSMTMLTTGFGATLGSAPVRRSYAVAVPVVGTMSLAFGFWYAAAVWSLMPYPF